MNFFLSTAVTAEPPLSADQQNELKTLQEEINKYQQQLSQQKAKEENVSSAIVDLDRRIDVEANILYRLKKQVDIQSERVQVQAGQVEKLENQISRLKEIIKKRLVYFYKYGRRKDYQWLLNKGAWRRAGVWLRYQKIIAENDRRNFEALVSRRIKLQQEQQLLHHGIAEKERAVQLQLSQTESIKTNRAKRRKYLESVQKDTQFIQQHLQELNVAQKEILDIISRSERERTEKEQQPAHKKDQNVAKSTRNYPFGTLKGRLPWPASGKVVTHFGKFRHPTLNTITENLGIEIEAPYGEPVHAVDAGLIQTITWQRGRGNIIIISHEDGYYTVYTHLADIRVNVSQQVQSGEIIGTVGDSGSLNGPVLHFQIWKNTENLDPETWLL